MDVSRWRPPERVQGTLVLSHPWCRAHPDAFLKRLKKANCPLARFKVGTDNGGSIVHRHRCKKNHANTVDVCMFLQVWPLCFCNISLCVTVLRMMMIMMMMSLHWLEGNNTLCSKKPTSAYCYYIGTSSCTSMLIRWQQSNRRLITETSQELFWCKNCRF